MKKTIFVAVVCLIGLTQSNAQVTFKPGLRGGANFAHFTKGDYYNNYDYLNSYDPTLSPNSNRVDFKSKTDFYLGFYGALHLSKYYTLQPEIDYSNQGTIIKSIGNPDAKYDVSYLSVAVVNKFTFSDKFNIHLGPTIDFVVDKNFTVDNEVDLAFLLGAGFNFTKNLGIEARIKKGVIPVIDDSYSSHSNVVISLGATYTFDLK